MPHWPNRRRGVRALAFRSVVHPEPAVAQLLATGSLADRQRAYAWIRRRGRTELADRVIADVQRRWGDGETGTLLAACIAGRAAASAHLRG